MIHRCSQCNREYATLMEFLNHFDAHNQGVLDASHQATNQEGQTRRDAADDGRVQEGQTAQRIEDRPQGDEPKAGHSDRAEPERTITEAEVFQAEYEAQVRQQAEAARERDLLAGAQPYKIRVTLNNPAANWVDLDVVVPWDQWLRGLQAWRGIAHDKGFIPLESIAFILHLDQQGKPAMPMGENVVPFKKPPVAT